ncbi:MAG: hypothetical protein HYU64_18980, partial [Armatimonadetes bacterium]|nr:hypothetical protein [Armatimonadota bacterium]
MAVQELKPVGSPQPAVIPEPAQKSGTVKEVEEKPKDPVDHADPIKPGAPEFPNIDFNQIRVHLATQYGDADNSEALQAKEDYQKSYDKAAEDLNRARSTYSELGPGTHDLGDGHVVVITKQDGKISVVTKEKGGNDGSQETTTTVTYNETDSQNGEIVTETVDTAGGNKQKTTVSKHGTSLAITDSSGRQTTYNISEKGGVVQEIRAPGSSGTVRTETNSDGSTTVTSTVFGPDGKPIVETATHQPDQER